MTVKVSDPVLDEIHRIRKIMSQERQMMSWEQWCSQIRKQTESFLKEKGYRLVKTPEGHLKIVRR